MAITRAELVTAPNFTDTDNVTVTYSNPSGTAVDSLEIGIYDVTGYTEYVPYRFVSKTATSYTFEFTDAERVALRSAVTQGDSMSVRFYIRTIIDGKRHLGTPLTRTFTIASAIPVVEGAISCDDETYNLTGSRTKLIKYISDVVAWMSVTPQKGATIAEDYCIIRNGTQTGWGSMCDFSDVESNVFTFTAEDDRGNVGTDTLTVEMVNYIKLTCSIGNNRPDALGNMTVTCAGDYFNGSFGKESNTLTVQCRYVGGGTQSSWTDMTISYPSTNRYTGDADFVIPDFDQNAFYTVEVKAWDKVSTVTGTPWVAKSLPIFHWGENDFVFEVPVTFNAGTNGSSEGGKTIDGDLLVTGDLRLKGNGSNYGNTLRFGDGDYAYICEPEDDCLVIKASSIDIQSDNVMINGDALGGSDEVISVGTTAMGTNGTWYWRKWRSGRAECYGKRNYGNMAINTAWGSLSTSEDFSQSLPSGLFVSAPEVVQISIVSTDKAAWILQGYTAGSTAVTPSATTTGTFSVVRPAAATLSQVYLGFNVIGRWK